jgi:hypothetical protein
MGEWKNARQNRSRRLLQSLFTLLMLDVYHCLAGSIREKGNNFHLRVSCAMPEIFRHEHTCSNSHRW